MCLELWQLCIRLRSWGLCRNELQRLLGQIKVHVKFNICINYEKKSVG